MADATHRAFMWSVELSQGYEEFRVECSAYKAPWFPSAETTEASLKPH